jgi:ferrous iron transport protein A
MTKSNRAIGVFSVLDARDATVRWLYWKLQVSFNKQRAAVDLRPGERGVLKEIALPEAFAERLMLLGFVPGVEVSAGPAAPAGDPRVYRVDGADIALRRETAQGLLLEV